MRTRNKEMGEGGKKEKKMEKKAIIKSQDYRNKFLLRSRKAIDFLFFFFLSPLQVLLVLAKGRAVSSLPPPLLPLNLGGN